MQSRFTAKGVTKDDKEVILAYELKEEEFKVDLYLVPRKSLKADTLLQLEKGWVDGEACEFPEGTTFINPNLNAESILPDDIRSEESGKIRIKQNEWAYQLLTAKLWESYLHELDELKKKAAALAQYDRQLFEDSKSFWERVLEHRKERDISQERLDKIKDDVNSIFEKLKTFRKSESAEFETASAKVRDEVVAKLEDLKKRSDAKANFKLLLEELKTIQNDSRKNRFTKADDVQLRKLFDSTFQYVNDQRNHFFSDKTETRVKGLNEVIEKMEASLNRDKKDLEYMAKKTSSKNISSLELQLIKVKSNMLNETIASKEEKLKDIRMTLEKLLKQSGKGAKHNEPKEKEKEEVKDEKVVTPDAEEASHPDEPNTSQSE
ncbi:MAG: hypothetical protein JWO06_2514 [Bacteroidota bacterium]|nr:hypothetical protein [Bacteroidota bacterium]